MTKVLLIAGGNSPERDVSLRSGAAVAQALTDGRHTVTVVDTASGVLDGSLAQSCDIAFPVLHGVGGEDGQIQSELAALSLPFVGSGVEASKLCFDKSEYKQLLAANGHPTPLSRLISQDSDLSAEPLLQAPYVVKPYNGGSSIDTFIVRDPAKGDLDSIRSALEQYGSMLVESLIEGTEITVAVLGDTALPIVEIIPPASGEFDYENKYNGASQELCPPEHISEAVQKVASILAVHIHRLCGCADFSRTDMIVRPNGELMVLETNTIPGMTNASLLPKAAQVAGFDMPALCDKLVRMALDRATAQSQKANRQTATA